MNDQPVIRILIADDHAILRDGIRSLLDRQVDMMVLGEASNGRDAVTLTGKLRPDVVLMDMAMPEMNGLEATIQIKRLYPQVQVLILTQHDDREYVEPALKAGASGYVLKRSGGREVVQAIREVYLHGAFLEPSVARHILEGFSQPDAPSNAALANMTGREREVLGWLVRGKSNKEIAALLSISPKTVSVHRSNLMIKLGIRSEMDLLRYAAQHGLVNLDE